MFRYDATVEAHTVNGYYVSYDEWGNKEEVMLIIPVSLFCVFNKLMLGLVCYNSG